MSSKKQNHLVEGAKELLLYGSLAIFLAVMLGYGMGLIR